MQAGEGLLLVGSLHVLSLPVISKRKLSCKDAALAPCFGQFDFEGLGREEPVAVTPAQTLGSRGWLSGHIPPLSTTILLPPRRPHINQVSIPTGSVSSQVSDGKGSDELIPVEDLGDNEFKGSPHPL